MTADAAATQSAAQRPRRGITLPDEFPARWCSDWGEDGFGLWMAFRYRGVRQRLRWIPAGEFVMGSPRDEPARDNDETQHQVVLSRGFWLAETACTQALWQAVMDDNPSMFKGPERPVEQVSWDHVQAFVEALNQRIPGGAFRLPSEAEWEYACRAGTKTPYWFGERIRPAQANFGQDVGETVDVTARPCNGWGLYQMHGNVWEWCADWYDKYPAGTLTDPTGPDRGEARVLRGGSWFFDGRPLRSAYRLPRPPRLPLRPHRLPPGPRSSSEEIGAGGAWQDER